MDIWQDELFFSMYYLAQIMLVISAIILALKTWKVSVYHCAAGFSAFLYGNIVLIDVNKKIAEIEQTNGDITSIEDYHRLGRVLSPVGFLAAGTGLFIFPPGRSVSF